MSDALENTGQQIILNIMYKKNLIGLTACLILSSFSQGSVPSQANLRVVDEDVISIKIEWEDHSSFGDIQYIQRKESSQSEFKTIVRLPSEAWVYKDLGLKPNTSYDYRIATHSNGVFSPWISTTGKTHVDNWTKVFNVKDYGAKGDGASNDTQPIRNAIKAAENNGGGVVFLPKGTYKVSLPDPVDESAIFRLNSSNMTIRGEGSSQTIISCFSPGLKHPETNWAYSSNGNLIRGTAFALNTNQKFTQKNTIFEKIRVTGNTRPTGDTAWWTSQQMEQGWDITHKGLYLANNNDNTLIRDCIWDSWRGEIIFSGDPNTKKLKIENSQFFNANSSAVSTSADFECNNVQIYDASNSCIESAFYNNLNGNPTGLQAGIFRNSSFIARATMMSDKSANPMLTHPNEGKESLAIFNTPKSWMVVDNCVLGKASNSGFLFDVGQHNLLVIDSEFTDNGTRGMIYFESKDKPDYQLKGGIYNCLFTGNTFNSNGGIVLNTANYNPLMQKNLHFVNNTVNLLSGKTTFLFDSHRHEGLRENFRIAENSFNISGGGVANFVSDQKNGGKPAIKPLWIDNSLPIPTDYEPGGSTQLSVYSSNQGPLPLVVHGPYYKIHDVPTSGVTEFEMNSFKERYPDGFKTKIVRSDSRGTVVFKRNPNWNDFPQDIILKGGESFEIEKKGSIFCLTSLNNKEVLRFNELNNYIAEPNDTPTTYSYFTGAQEGKEVTITTSGENIIIENNGGIKLSDGQNFVSNGAEFELKFIVVANTLIELERKICNRSLVILE